MKKTIALILLTSLWVTGCSSRSADDMSFTQSAASVVIVDSVDAADTDEEEREEPVEELVAVGQVRVVTDEPAILTGGGNSIVITALVTDENNRALEGRSVDFSSDRGALQNISAVTNAAGAASAELILAGDNRNQNFEVYADVGLFSGSTIVATHGSNLTVEAPAEVVSGDSADVVLTLRAGNGSAIPNEWVNISSSANNSIEVVNALTDANGVLTFTLDTALGSDTLSFDSVGGTVLSTQTITVVDSVQSVETPVKIRVISNESMIETGGSDTATITTLVTDEANRVIEGHVVEFSSTGGVLQNISATTNAAGQATAELNLAGDFRNQDITVTADAGDQVGDVSIAANGSAVSIAGPTALVSGNRAELTITLTSGNGQAIPNHQVSIASLAGNTVSPISVVTDAGGKAIVSVASDLGDDTITVSALEGTVVSTHDINVADDILTINAPQAGGELPVGADSAIEVLWMSNGTPVVGEELNFSVTAGELSMDSAVTDASGIASLTVSSVSSGPATIAIEDASDADPATQIDVEFVATEVDNISVDAAPARVATNNESIVSAVVTDSVGNPVKGVVVSFYSDDLKGGNLSPVSALTDSDGRARVTFTAGTLPTEIDEIVINAAADSNSVGIVEDTINLTISERQLNVIIGLAGSLVEANSDTRYTRAGVVQVTDGSGTPVPDANISVTLVPIWYRYGQMITVDSDGNGDLDKWELVPGEFFTCAAEDENGNRVLDDGEDDNGNGTLDPQDPALIQADPANTPTVVGGEITTDADGVGFFSLAYPQSNARWFAVSITARAQALGTESTASFETELSVIAADVANEEISPPNVESPYGPFLGDPPVCDPFSVN